jgi:hypothetical protein
LLSRLSPLALSRPDELRWVARSGDPANAHDCEGRPRSDSDARFHPEPLRAAGSCALPTAPSRPCRSPLDLGSLHLHFGVSSNEEHVELRATSSRGAFDLGVHVHHYLLLTLARRRLADEIHGVGVASGGWLDAAEFPSDPMMASGLLNLYVFRIRKQFRDIGVTDARRIVERRTSANLLRIGTNKITLEVI